MQSRPDSALTILRAIDSSALNSASDRALFALLMSQALDKNYIDVTSDSLIASAAEYFASTDDSHHNMLAQYYLGRVKFNAGAYSQSLVAMFKAYDLAKAANNHLYAGLAARGIAYVYSETFNGAEELKYAKIEHEEMQKCNIPIYATYALLTIAKAYCNNAEYANATKIAKQLIDSANQTNNIYLLADCYRIIGRSSINHKDFTSAISYFEKINGLTLANYEDSILLGISYADNYDLDKATSIINQLINNESSLKSERLRYETFKRLGLHQEALNALAKFDSINTTEFTKRINNDITSSVINNYNLSAKLSKAESRVSKIRMWFVGTFSVLFILIILIIGWSYIKHNQAIIERNIAIATNYKELISIRESMYSSAQKSVASLIKTKFETLDYLCKVYYENPVDKVVNKKLSASVTKLIDDFSSNKQIDSLERLVNEHCSDLIKNFRSDFPKLKDADYKLFLFSVLGFSNSTISIFLHEEKITAIYDRKRRLKDKIKLLANDRSVYYLSFLS